MMHSSTSSAEMPARSSAAVIAMLPSLGDVRLDRAPPKLPMGVRAAEAMTISVRGAECSSDRAVV
jgi:hypothetical protein